MQVGGTAYDELKVLGRDADENPTATYAKVKFGMLMTDRDALTQINNIRDGDVVGMEMTNGESPDYPL